MYLQVSDGASGMKQQPLSKHHNVSNNAKRGCAAGAVASPEEVYADPAASLLHGVALDVAGGKVHANRFDGTLQSRACVALRCEKGMWQSHRCQWHFWKRRYYCGTTESCVHLSIDSPLRNMLVLEGILEFCSSMGDLIQRQNPPREPRREWCR